MTTNYALLPDRIKALMIDAIILIAAMYLVSEIFSAFEQVPNFVRFLAALFIFVLYDPIFTSTQGGTIGHTYSGIGVRRENDLSSNINFPMAFFRFIFKYFLGWLSLLTVTGNKEKKAIHDFIAGSVVIQTKTDN